MLDYTKLPAYTSVINPVKQYSLSQASENDFNAVYYLKQIEKSDIDEAKKIKFKLPTYKTEIDERFIQVAQLYAFIVNCSSKDKFQNVLNCIYDLSFMDSLINDCSGYKAMKARDFADRLCNPYRNTIHLLREMFGFIFGSSNSTEFDLNNIQVAPIQFNEVTNEADKTNDKQEHS